MANFIGTGADQVPVNGMLGTAAYRDADEFLHAILLASETPPTVARQVTLEATNNTTITIKMMGSDGVVRSTTLTLA
jgi:hypothetical protein